MINSPQLDQQEEHRRPRRIVLNPEWQQFLIRLRALRSGRHMLVIDIESERVTWSVMASGNVEEIKS
jgi:hypothetical protein